PRVRRTSPASHASLLVFSFSSLPPPYAISSLSPYTTLFRSNIIRLFEQDRSWSSITTEESGPPSENPIYQKTETTSIIEILAPYALIGAGIVISGLIIFFAIKAYKKVKKPLRQLESSNLVTYSHVDDMITRQNFLSTLK